MAADTIVISSSAPLAGLDALADEVGINVAVQGDPAAAARIAKALEGRSTRLGVGVDATLWTDDAAARRALPAIKDRLRYISLGGAATRPGFFHELNRLNVRPLILMLNTTGFTNASGDLFSAIDAFENAVQPAYGANFTDFSRSVPIRRDLVRPRAARRCRTRNRAAIRRGAPEDPRVDPREAIRRTARLPKVACDRKPSGHVARHHPARERDARGDGPQDRRMDDGARQRPEQSQIPKVKECDAVFLNSIVGEFAADLAVREGLARYVREGGGLGGVHGTPWASRNWDEFAGSSDRRARRIASNRA
jgi:hypothetical protein